MAAMEQLHDSDDEGRYLVDKGCVGEGTARSYLAWLASADLYDPEPVLADPAIVRHPGPASDRGEQPSNDSANCSALAWLLANEMR